jgi:DNA polymerase III delta prime subunit
MKKYFIPFLIVNTIFLCSCASLFKKRNMPNQELLKIEISTLAPDQFNDYISQLSEIVKKSESDYHKRLAHLYIARALVYHRNPSIQYDRAFESFNEYLKLESDQNQKDEIMSWIYLLNRLSKLKAGNQILAKQINDQAKTIQQLEIKIKRLDSLYFEIEKKKKKNNNKSNQ